jgi:hypothetical protein
MPGTTIDALPSIVSAASSDERLMSWATDRSSDPVTMATVWPTATMPSATLRWRMSVVVPLVRNVPPSRPTTTHPTTTIATSAPQIGWAPPRVRRRLAGAFTTTPRGRRCRAPRPGR